MNDEIEVWLLFAPFWLLGIVALVGSIWHMFHAWNVTRHAQAAGHVRKPAPFSRGLAWHELTDRGRHHLRRAFIAFGAFVALILLGIGVGAAVGLLLGR
ncbi:MAG: hypothetical protein FJX11_11905 [Alphaproteobacteria bacterium]|nr:hypothetical protein [Alphaproteobacteria bacterium]